MTDYELNFSLKIEEMLSGIADPAYRCLVVEVKDLREEFRLQSVLEFEMFEVINVLLKRNAELRFVQPLDVDTLINDAVHLFQQQTNSNEPFKDFYSLPISLVGGSTGYMIRVIINSLFDAKMDKPDEIDGNINTNNDICKIS